MKVYLVFEWGGELLKIFNSLDKAKTFKHHEARRTFINSKEVE